MTSVVGADDWQPSQTKTSHFEGRVTIEEPADRSPSAHRVLRVTFHDGASTHWHRHPLGQVLVVLTGRGRLGVRGGQVRTLLPGDVVVCAPFVDHWHGAAEGERLEHLSITADSQDSWLEPVEKP